MTRHIDSVIAEALARLTAALPSALVVKDDDWPRRPPVDGWVNLHEGDMDGGPDIDLSPVRYNWVWPIDVEVVACPANPTMRHEALADLITAVSGVVEADRFLGGLVTYLDLEPGNTEDIQIESGAQGRGGRLTLLAQFSTTSPSG